MTTSNKLCLESSLPPTALLERLQDGADKASYFVAWFGKKPLVLKTKGFDISLRKKISYNNSFQPLFIGRILESDRGSMIEGVFRMHRFVTIFMVFWFVMLASMELTFYRFHLSGNLKLSSSLLLFQPLGMGLFAVPLTYFGKWLGRKEPAFITAYIQACCDNKDFDPDSLR